uniref:C2H2-type domain-containing protein n=1 Tax=Myripristis murdjan TaxID=586833 RepID=A0A667Y4W8_9TELE
NKYTRFQSGTVKPFRCRICTYRTNIMSLLKSHLLKKHAETVVCCSLTESVYSEPPDVQRQLNHYSFVAQASASAATALQHTRLPEDSLLQCEFCNFTTGHLSSVRRHYLNRHGKKVMKCRDCCFFTGLRKNLEMHIETGHSNCQSQPTHQKDLRCPLCLYQTKNKNNMIDHIVLHREERVIPIEVRRPKLSRYLQGIVFRCHKCTFTSASADNLRLHILKHDDIKPYKCRLCYFDCTQLSDLEAHLCDKHQVVRNHELVGQINLDQLEARVDKMSEEEEGFSNLEQQDNEAEDMETNIKMEEDEREVAIMMEPPTENPFSCKYCGRNLISSTELERENYIASKFSTLESPTAPTAAENRSVLFDSWKRTTPAKKTARHKPGVVKTFL